MNKSVRKLLIAALIAAAAVAPADAQRQRKTINNPVTQAVFRVYAEQLSADPNNYDTLLRRANDYYHFDEYRKALDDVNRAIECTPAKDEDHLFRCCARPSTTRPDAASSPSPTSRKPRASSHPRSASSP